MYVRYIASHRKTLLTCFQGTYLENFLGWCVYLKYITTKYVLLTRIETVSFLTIAEVDGSSWNMLCTNYIQWVISCWGSNCWSTDVTRHFLTAGYVYSGTWFSCTWNLFAHLMFKFFLFPPKLPLECCCIFFVCFFAFCQIPWVYIQVVGKLACCH